MPSGPRRRWTRVRWGRRKKRKGKKYSKQFKRAIQRIARGPQDVRWASQSTNINNIEYWCTLRDLANTKAVFTRNDQFGNENGGTGRTIQRGNGFVSLPLDDMEEPVIPTSSFHPERSIEAAKMMLLGITMHLHFKCAVNTETGNDIMFPVRIIWGWYNFESGENMSNAPADNDLPRATDFYTTQNRGSAGHSIMGS